MDTDTLRQKVERMMGQPHRLTSLERQAVIAAYRKGERKPLYRIYRDYDSDGLTFIYRETRSNRCSYVSKRNVSGDPLRLF